MRWPSVELGDLARFTNGMAFKPLDWSDDGAVPIIRIQNLTDPTKPYNRTSIAVPDRFLVRPGELLVSWSATLGVFEWSEPERAAVNQHIFRVEPDESCVARRYLRHMLVNALTHMERHLHGATMQHVNRREFLSTKIPVPPREEQVRIAAVLDGAEDLRNRGRQALDRWDQLKRAIYPATFGPPGKWPERQLGEILERIDSGKSPVCASHPAPADGWGVLKLGAVTYGEYRPQENKALKPDFEPRESDEVRPNDVLLARKNTLDLVGASAFVEVTPAHRLLPDLLFRLVPDAQAPVHPRFLQAVLSQPDRRAALRALAGGSAGSMPNISKARLRTLRLPVPPSALQSLYVIRVASIQSRKSTSERALTLLDALFASLQHRAFAGEL